jgi:hypothetical protein
MKKYKPLLLPMDEYRCVLKIYEAAKNDDERRAIR